MKRSCFLLFLSLFAFTSFADSLLEMNGRDWEEWSHARKIEFITGFLAGTYTIIQMEVEYGSISRDEYRAVESFYKNASVYAVVDEVTAFYEQTQCYDYPVMFAVNFRNQWKDLRSQFLPWPQMRLRFKGWK
jgi:hypothetical protein